MDNTPDTSLLARIFGQNWRTTIGGILLAVGGVLAASTTGRWQVGGQLLAAIGGALLGFNARDKGVSSEQMDNANPLPPAQLPKSLLVLLLCGLAVAGCLAPVTVNVFSSRMVTAIGTNTVQQSIEGGANLSSNATSATIPLK